MSQSPYQQPPYGPFPHGQPFSGVPGTPWQPGTPYGYGHPPGRHPGRKTPWWIWAALGGGGALVLLCLVGCLVFRGLGTRSSNLQRVVPQQQEALARTVDEFLQALVRRNIDAALAHRCVAVPSKITRAWANQQLESANYDTYYRHYDKLEVESVIEGEARYLAPELKEEVPMILMNGEVSYKTNKPKTRFTAKFVEDSGKWNLYSFQFVEVVVPDQPIIASPRNSTVPPQELQTAQRLVHQYLQALAREQTDQAAALLTQGIQGQFRREDLAAWTAGPLEEHIQGYQSLRVQLSVKLKPRDPAKASYKQGIRLAGEVLYRNGNRGYLWAELFLQDRWRVGTVSAFRKIPLPADAKVRRSPIFQDKRARELAQMLRESWDMIYTFFRALQTRQHRGALAMFTCTVDAWRGREELQRVAQAPQLPWEQFQSFNVYIVKRPLLRLVPARFPQVEIFCVVRLGQQAVSVHMYLVKEGDQWRVLKASTLHDEQKKK